MSYIKIKYKKIKPDETTKFTDKTGIVNNKEAGVSSYLQIHKCK